MALRKVNHPGIVKLFEIIQEGERLILIIEFISGDDLYTLIKEKKKIPEIEAAFLLKGVALALKELHKLEILYIQKQ
jgi:serine/threonine protein kinase